METTIRGLGYMERVKKKKMKKRNRKRERKASPKQPHSPNKQIVLKFTTE